MVVLCVVVIDGYGVDRKIACLTILACSIGDRQNSSVFIRSTCSCKSLIDLRKLRCHKILDVGERCNFKQQRSVADLIVSTSPL